eukprot:Awhi_evm1s8143
MKGQEERDLNLGRAVGLAAVVHSRRCKEDTSKLVIIIQHLLKLATKKTYMAEISFSIISDALIDLEEKDFAEHVLPLISPLFTESIDSWTPEVLGLGLALQSQYKDFDFNTLFPAVPGTRAIKKSKKNKNPDLQPFLCDLQNFN